MRKICSVNYERQNWKYQTCSPRCGGNVSLHLTNRNGQSPPGNGIQANPTSESLLKYSTFNIFEKKSSHEAQDYSTCPPLGEKPFLIWSATATLDPATINKIFGQFCLRHLLFNTCFIYIQRRSSRLVQSYPSRGLASKYSKCTIRNIPETRVEYPSTHPGVG